MTYSRDYNKSSTTGATSGALLPTIPEHPSSSPIFKGVRVAQSLVFCVVFCISLFSYFLTFHCLTFDSQIRITPLVSLILSCHRKKSTKQNVIWQTGINQLKENDQRLWIKYMLINAEHSIRYAWFLLLLLACSSNLKLSLFRHMIKQYHVNTTLF